MGLSIRKHALEDIFSAASQKSFEQQWAERIASLNEGEWRLISVNTTDVRPVHDILIARVDDAYYASFSKTDIMTDEDRQKRTNYFEPRELGKVLYEEGVSSYFRFHYSPPIPCAFGPLTEQEAADLTYIVHNLNLFAEFKRKAIQKLWDEPEAGNPSGPSLS